MASSPQQDSSVLRLKPVGANPVERLEGLEELPGKNNYFIGNDPKKWRTNVPTYAKVRYRDLYPGVDLLYYGNQDGQLEYDFIVAPGADPKVVALSIGGKTNTGSFERSLPVSLDFRGDIVLHADGGEIRFEKPIVYQEGADGRREYRVGRYVLASKRVGTRQPIISFAIGDYDHSRPLIVDPAIAYSTYLGGTTDASIGNGIAVFTDPSTGHVYAYVTGQTCASDFPTVNAEQSANGGGCFGNGYAHGDAFVTKFDPSAVGVASVIYSTYLGGSGGDWATAIAVDSTGNAYITGVAESTDFPVVNAYQSALRSVVAHPGGAACVSVNPQNAFLAKLRSDGSNLMYSTYFGGSSCDSANAIALDFTGRAYIAGGTLSSDLPTVNPFQSRLQSPKGNAFAAEFDTVRSGSASLLYSSYIGGAECPLSNSCYGDSALALAVDATGAMHLGGVTTSTNFPTVNGLQASAPGGVCENGGYAFYSKLTPSGVGPGQLLYSTYLGGCLDIVNGIAVDSTGDAYITGGARSGVFPVTPGSLGLIPTGTSGLGQAFVAKINPFLVGSSSLLYSTIVAPGDRSPGTGSSGGTGIAVDANGNAFVGGAADPGMPLVNPVQESPNGVVQSINGGQSWTGLTHGLSEFPISALAIDPSTSPRTLYAASYGGGAIGAYYVAGVFRSSDGGLNWTKAFQMPDSITPNQCANGKLFTCIFVLAVDPINPSNVYAGTSAGVFKSADRGSTWSVFNTGLSATAVLGVPTLLFDGGTLYAGANDGLYMLNPGASYWTPNTLTVDVQNIAVDAKTTPHTIYTVSSTSGAYRSTDDGATWTTISGAFLGEFAGSSYPSTVTVDKSTSPGTLMAFVDSDQNGNAGIFESSDQGNTWNEIPSPSGNCGTAVDTSTTPTTFYACGNGVFESRDGGNTWTAVFPSSTSAMALDPTTAGPSTRAAVYAGTSFPSGGAFVMELNPTGSTILFSSYLGGVGIQAGASGIALDSVDNIYLTGSFFQGSQPGNAFLNTFPSINAYQSSGGIITNGGLVDAFITKLGSQDLPSSSGGSVTTQVGVQTGAITVTLPNITGSTTSSAPTLTVTPLSSTQTANFSLSNNLGAYDIATTASYSGSVTLCFQALTVNDVSTFNNLELIHIVNGVPQNVTTSYDFNTRTICGSVTSLSPFILVKGALGQLNDLVRTVNESDLRHGIQTSLDAKLQNAVSALSSARNNNYTTVCNLMNAFINSVQAQTGQSITAAEAATFIAAAKQIMASVGCAP